MSRRRLSVGLAACFLALVNGIHAVGQSKITGTMTKIDLPDDRFYLLFRDYYKGEYSRVGKSFSQMTSYKDANGLFLESICYWTMQAECHFRLGDFRQAVELHEKSLKLYVDWLAWRERTQFPPQIQAANNAWRQTAVTWGTPTRTAQYANIPNSFQYLFGRLDIEQNVREGGAIQLPNMRAVDLAQILRCTSLCLYRRNQIKGPICTRDPFTNKLIASLTTVAASDGNLSSVWNGVLLGLAQSSAGKSEQAIATLKSVLQFNGGMDHTLTPIALLEMGRTSFALGNFGDATKFYMEASYCAAVYKQFDLIGEALAGANQCHLRTRPKEVFSPLVNAIRWADHEGADALQATLLVELLKNQTELEQGSEANTTLGLIRRLANGNDLDETSLAVPVNYCSASYKFQTGELKSAEEDFSIALQNWRKFSPRLFQLQFADQLLNSRQLAPREADLIYSDLLRDPNAADWLNDPCEAICFLMTDHVASLQMWFDILVVERRMEPAFAVADQIRRHRFYSGVPLGGRLMTLRWMMEAPPELLGETTLAQRHEWIQRFPKYDQVSREAAQTLAKLRELPIVPDANSPEQKQQRTLLEQLAKFTETQEQILIGIALRREPAELAFARPLPINASEQLLPSKTLLLSFLETGQGVSVISVSERVINLEATVNKKNLTKAVGELLRQIGNVHEKNTVEVAELKDGTWQAAAAELHKLLFPNRQTAYWNEFDEIVIVPDGVLWYAPLELVLSDPKPTKPLRIRYCPMVAMAIPNTLPPPQFPRTLLAGRRSVDKKLQTRFDEQLALLKIALPNIETMISVGKSPTSLLSATTDRLIAWTDEWKSTPLNGSAFSLIPDTNNKPGHSLVDWHLLPWSGPRQIIVPQFSSDAADGLKTKNAGGQELFQLACHSIACGAQTMLISRWNVGNSSSFQASSEFAAASTTLSAIDAWQQTIEKIKSLPIDVSESSRVKGPKEGIGDQKSTHPFFWSGYLLVDTGWKPPVAEPPAESAQ